MSERGWWANLKCRLCNTRVAGTKTGGKFSRRHDKQGKVVETWAEHWPGDCDAD